MLNELDIINAMLASTGTAPLTAFDTSHPYYIRAKTKLDVVNSAVQGRGWWFNAGPRSLTPNGSGELVLPSTTLHADPVDTSKGYVVRGTRLFDIKNATYNIGADTTINFIELVEVADLPPTAAEFVKARAVYEFYLDEEGNEPKLSKYLSARDEAWVKIKADHLKNADLNFFNGLSAAQMQRGVRSRRLPLSDN